MTSAFLDSLTLFRGWCKFALPYIISSILSRRIYEHTQNLLTFNIYIYGSFLQNFMGLGGCVQNLWTFWNGGLHEEFFSSKSLKMEYAIKSKNLLRIYSNFHTIPILIVKTCWKSQISKTFKFGPPQRKTSNFTRFLRFLAKNVPIGTYE